MFHTPAHKQSTSLVAARAAATRINIERGNDLVFPQGNEHGDFSEPLWLASVSGGRKFHGRTPDEAAARCVESLRAH